MLALCSAPALVAATVALALAVAPLAAYADNAWSGAVPTKARALAERGRASHDAGDYAAAIAAFTQAYVMAPSPALLFNLAQAYRLQGDCEDAALMYRRYLATNPSSEGRALAEMHLASVERCIHMLSLHIPIEAPSGRVVTPPPREKLTAALIAPPPSRKGAIEKDVGVGLVLGGGVALAVAGYYTVVAHNAADDVAAAYARGAKWKDVAATDERGKAASSRAKILGAGGAIGVAGGIVTYLIGKHTERVPVTVATTRQGVELGMAWAF
jgi:tetratricopeptide (TPR) repeat protein